MILFDSYNGDVSIRAEAGAYFFPTGNTDTSSLKKGELEAMEQLQEVISNARDINKFD